MLEARRTYAALRHFVVAAAPIEIEDKFIAIPHTRVYIIRGVHTLQHVNDFIALDGALISCPVPLPA